MIQRPWVAPASSVQGTLRAWCHQWGGPLSLSRSRERLSTTDLRFSFQLSPASVRSFRRQPNTKSFLLNQTKPLVWMASSSLANMAKHGEKTSNKISQEPGPWAQKWKPCWLMSLEEGVCYTVTRSFRSGLSFTRKGDIAVNVLLKRHHQDRRECSEKSSTLCQTFTFTITTAGMGANIYPGTPPASPNNP